MLFSIIFLPKDKFNCLKTMPLLKNILISYCTDNIKEEWLKGEYFVQKRRKTNCCWN